MAPDSECDKNDQLSAPNPRRKFLKQSSALTALALASPALLKATGNNLDEKVAEYFEKTVSTN